MENIENSLATIHQFNSLYWKTFPINDIEIIDYDEELVDRILFEVIQKISLNLSNESPKILNSGFFRYGDLDVIFGIRYFHEESGLEMYPSFEDPTKIVEMSFFEFKRRMIEKEKIKGDPLIIIFSRKVEPENENGEENSDINN